MSYDPDTLSISIGGVVLEGYAVDTFITIERNEHPAGISKDLHGTTMNQYLNGICDRARVDPTPFNAATPNDSPLLPTVTKDFG